MSTKKAALQILSEADKTIGHLWPWEVRRQIRRYALVNPLEFLVMYMFAQAIARGLGKGFFGLR